MYLRFDGCLSPSYLLLGILLKRAPRTKCNHFYEVWPLFLESILLFIWTKMKLALVLGHTLEVLNCIAQLPHEYCKSNKSANCVLYDYDARLLDFRLFSLSVGYGTSLGFSVLIYKRSWLIGFSPRPIPAKILLSSSMCMSVNPLVATAHSSPSSPSYVER